MNCSAYRRDIELVGAVRTSQSYVVFQMITKHEIVFRRKISSISITYEYETTNLRVPSIIVNCISAPKLSVLSYRLISSEKIWEKVQSLIRIRMDLPLMSAKLPEDLANAPKLVRPCLGMSAIILLLHYKMFRPAKSTGNAEVTNFWNRAVMYTEAKWLELENWKEWERRLSSSWQEKRSNKAQRIDTAGENNLPRG